MNATTDTQRPQVGDGAHYNVGSDSHACTVVAVSPSGHQVTVQRDRMRPIPGKVADGFGHRWTEADAVFVLDQDAPREVFTRRTRKRKDWRTGAVQTYHAWILQGSKSIALHAGRSEYRNPSF